MKDVLKDVVLNTACALLGRKELARLGRSISRRARLDVPNGIEANGELMVIDSVLAHQPSHNSPAVIFDCGANVGRYVQAIAQRAASIGATGVTVHAFEPSAKTFASLQRNLAGTSGIQQVLNCMALSDQVLENASLHVAHETAGTNSLLKGDVERPTEAVRVTTLDRYCEANGIANVLLLKIDTEGNDYNVLLGAQRILASGKIAAVQFEYNYRWIYARRFLRDVFELLAPLGYDIGKVTPKGIEFYPFWHPELETYVEGNYVACRTEWRGRFPQINWWAADIVTRK
jgi:FkbM family methyltransferase